MKQVPMHKHLEVQIYIISERQQRATLIKLIDTFNAAKQLDLHTFSLKGIMTLDLEVVCFMSLVKPVACSSCSVIC